MITYHYMQVMHKTQHRILLVKQKSKKIASVSVISKTITEYIKKRTGIQWTYPLLVLKKRQTFALGNEVQLINQQGECIRIQFGFSELQGKNIERKGKWLGPQKQIPSLAETEIVKQHFLQKHNPGLGADFYVERLPGQQPRRNSFEVDQNAAIWDRAIRKLYVKGQ